MIYFILPFSEKYQKFTVGQEQVRRELASLFYNHTVSKRLLQLVFVRKDTYIKFKRLVNCTQWT